MTSITRRSFNVGFLSTGAAFAAGVRAPSANFPTDARSRIAVATYPFRRMIVSPSNADRDVSKTGMDLMSFAHFVRTEFDVRGIEPLHSHFSSTSRDAVVKLRKALDAASMYTVNIPVDAPVELCSADPSKRDAGNACYRHWIDVASLLRSPSIRIWIPRCSDIKDIPKAVEALQPTLDYAAAHNIVVNFENDDPVLNSDARVLAAIRAAGSEYLRALPDFANSLMGGDETFNRGAVERMFKHAWNIAHVKDAEVIRGKRSTVSLPDLFGIAKAAGYRGYYSMESDSDVDPVADTKRLIEQTLALI